MAEPASAAATTEQQPATSPAENAAASSTMTVLESTPVSPVEPHEFSDFVSAADSLSGSGSSATPPDATVAPSSLHGATPVVAALNLPAFAAPLLSRAPLLTPAVHADSASLPSFFSPLESSTMPASALGAFTPFTPATAAAAGASASPIVPAAARSDAGRTPSAAEAYAAIAASHTLSPHPGSVVSGASALTPAACVTANTAPAAAVPLMDGPLSFAAQYSPNAATRRLVGKPTSNSSGALLGSSTSGTNSGLDIGSSGSSAAAAAAVSTVAAAPAARSSGFLSSLFGWGSSSSSSNPKSLSVPSTPDSDHAPHSAALLQFPHTTTNASLRLPSSVSQPTSLSNLRGSGSGTAASASAVTAGAQAQRNTISSSPPTRPSLVSALQNPIPPLSSKESSALLSYSQRLKASLSAHESKISRLQALKKKYQLTRNEETAIWTKFAISSLVSIASSLYHTHLLHCSALLQQEFSFTAELSSHLNQVQLVLEHKVSLDGLLREIEERVESFLDEADAKEEAAAIAAATAAAEAFALEGGGSASAAKKAAAKVAAAAASAQPRAASASIVHKPHASPAAMKAMRERRRSSSSSNGGSAGSAAAFAPSSSEPGSPQPSPSAAAPSSSLSHSALKSRFLTSPEIESMFWPDSATLSSMDEQATALAETAAKLERTYKEMQRKALSQTDSKQSRTFKLFSLLSKHGLDSADIDGHVLGEVFYTRLENDAQRNHQLSFNALILDQRVEEGRLIGKWLDRVSILHSQRIANPHVVPPASERVDAATILGFLDSMRVDLSKRYDLPSMERERLEQRARNAENLVREQQQREAMGADGSGSPQHAPHDYTLADPLSLYLSRMLFPKLSLLVNALCTEKESDLDQWYARKLAWIRALTREQLGLPRNFLPIGCDMHGTHDYVWPDPPEAAGASGADPHALPSAGGVDAAPNADDDDDLVVLTAEGVDAEAEAEEHWQSSANDYDDDGDVHGVSEPPSESEQEDGDVEAQSISQFLSASDARHVKRRRASAINPNLPFQSAMHMLHRLNRGVVRMAPLDLLYVLVRVIREITRCANANLKAHREAQKEAQAAAAARAVAAVLLEATPPTTPSAPPSALDSVLASPPAGPALSPPAAPAAPAPSHDALNADNMFPLVLYVVIHSGLLRPHFLLGTISRFVNEQSRHFGTLGYSLILIESAVSHVCDMSKADVAAASAAGAGAGSLSSPKKKNRSGSAATVTPPSAGAGAAASSLLSPFAASSALPAPPPPPSALSPSSAIVSLPPPPAYSPPRKLSRALSSSSSSPGSDAAGPASAAAATPVPACLPPTPFTPASPEQLTSATASSSALVALPSLPETAADYVLDTEPGAAVH